jgi:Raf kinase inhibitor-like YbhB/YbcL family protein
MSSAFPEGGNIPALHTCDGADFSPALEWSGAPEGTQSFALVVDDPDASSGNWTHWLLYDLPAGTTNLPQGYRVAAPALEGRNDFGRPGFGGPCPPKGHGSHRYNFRLCALNTATLGLPVAARRADVEKALKKHVLAEAKYLGRYERR